MKVSVIGCGYVGLSTGVVLADLGHDVIGVEIDSEKLEKLSRAETPIYEAHLQELMARCIASGHLKFTGEHLAASPDADVIIVAVGTPTRDTWEIDLSQIETAISSTAEAIEHRDVKLPPPLVVIKSTVPSGTSDYLIDLLNLKTKWPYRIASNPEFLREGQAIFDTFYPDRIVVGADDPESFAIMEQLYSGILNQDFEDSSPRPKRPAGFHKPVPMVKTSRRSSELIKYAANAFLATKISFINEIANLCEEVGADVNEVSRGIGLDTRIGPQFLKAGIGYGGSCFPKDTKALHQHAGSRGYTFTLLNAVIEVNRIQRYRFLAKIRRLLNPLGDKMIGVLGIAFKPGTDDIREAPSIDLMRELKRDGVLLKAADPQAIENAKKVFDGCEYFDDIYECARHCDALVVITEWPEFINLDWERVAGLMTGKIVFDGRNCLDRKVLKDAGLTLIGVGW
jgi:UDPglucose 6-dehydrogenase